MGYQPLAYDDAEHATAMRLDCDRIVAQLSPFRVRSLRASIAERAVAPAPSLRFEDNDREVPKRDIEVGEAAVRLAAALHLHLD